VSQPTSTTNPGRLSLHGMGNLRRTASCAEVDNSKVGQEVVLAGWVQRRRDHGGVIFVDLRDRGAFVQVVFRPDVAEEAHTQAHHLRSEYVIMVKGKVEPRSEDTVNANIRAGDIEIAVSELRILNSATPPPFPIEEDAGVDESVRMRHRIHDLRRPPLQRALRTRHELFRAARAALSELDFIEVETPILTKSTPEGARDFLVPSRVHNGEFYALPQSPQIMKQLLMVAGYERYFQISRCFRDEDLRADRQPEFTQIDLEMSFVGEEEIIQVLERVTKKIFSDVGDIDLGDKIKRIDFVEAMDRYGCDKPDTRIQLELVDLTDVFRTSELRAFRAGVDKGGIVKCLPIHDAKDVSRGRIDKLESLVKKELGGKGLAWVRILDDGEWQSPIAKFLSEEEKEAIAKATDARPGSVLLFASDTKARANAILTRLRTDMGWELGRVEDRPWDVLFVVNFPLFEEEEDGSITYAHQPFVAPVEDDIELLQTDPLAVRATHYDLVINGVEIGSGSLRNHRSDVQRKILEVLGYSEEESRSLFGFLLDGLEIGAPPHGGFAFGLDRMVMMLVGADNLREVIAFPKTQRGQDLLMHAPAPVAADQLDELGLELQPQEDE
jgi:aspartyl-tRNA synthetase